MTELARNNLKSQLDVSFAEVNVSEAKLLLLRAQDSVQQALAELGRAMGSDLPANYQLAEEPLPSGPPATADQLVAQALGNRPELASLRFSRDASYKFADAEKDLSRPTVSVVGGRRILALHQHASHLSDSGRIRRHCAPMSAFPCSTDICSRPAARLP